MIMQQLYLVATALNLAPCSLGFNDSELFARATSLDPWTDVCVGELSSRLVQKVINGESIPRLVFSEVH